MPGEYFPMPIRHTILPSTTRAAYVERSSVEKKTSVPTTSPGARMRPGTFRRQSSAPVVDRNARSEPSKLPTKTRPLAIAGVE